MGATLSMEIEICMKNHKIESGMVHAGPRVYCQLLTPHKFWSSGETLSMQIEICMLAIMKNHKIWFGMVPAGPRAYCQLLTPTSLGQAVQHCQCKLKFVCWPL